jgi:eukaryotic-like serine/threonine-protein kinase
MPYVRGESLRERLRRDGQLPIEEAVQLAREVADALDCAHRLGVVHRDIKPENVLLSEGHARVADFGVAKALEAAGGGQLTETGIAVGTPAYMSPEQASGGPVDARTDQYSLGCVLYELLAGEPPYTGTTAQALLAKRILEPVPHVRTLRESVPDYLERALTRALARAPADRFLTAAEFARALSIPSPPQIDTSAPATPPITSTKSRQKVSRTGALRMAAAIGLVAAAATVVSILNHDPHQTSNPPRVSASSMGLPNPARLAVLYFHDFSDSRELAYLPDALTEALITELAQVRGLDVVSRHGSALYRHVDVPRDSIARALQVGTLIDGSVERVGERIRVTIRLVDGVSGADFARATIEKLASAPREVVDTVAQQVAELLRVRLGEEVRLRSTRISTASTAAWSLLQRAENVRKEAEELVGSRPTLAVARFMQSDSIAARSEQADSTWPVPRVFRSQVAYRISRLSFDPQVASPWIEQGLHHAARALMLTNREPSALASRGILAYWKWLLQLGGDSAQSEHLLRNARTDLETAVKVEPQLADAWSALSHLYMQLPDLERAKLAAIRAYEADTYLTGIDMVLYRLFTTSYDLEQFEEAARWCKVGATRFPEHPRFVECQLWLVAESGEPKNVAEAWRLAKRWTELSPTTTRPHFQRQGELFVAAVLAQAGLEDSARAVIERARASSKEDPNLELPYLEARAYLLLGDRDRALQSLKAYFAGDPRRKAAGIADERWFRDLKGDPRLEALTRP